MKSIITFLAFILVPILSFSQSMASVFNLLPPDCTPELNSGERKILLKDKEYVLPGGDSIETVKYNIDIDEANQYLRYEFTYTTGQRAFIAYEVRKFKKTDGSSLILFSSYGGLMRAFDQSEIHAFEYRNKRLVRLKKELFQPRINVSWFLKLNTPDSIKKQVEEYTSCSYDLSPDLKNGISCRIYFEVFTDEFNNYLLGDAILFTWTGKSFTRSKVTHLE